VISSEQAIDLVERAAHVRVFSGALGHQDLVMAEGEVIAYCPAPTLMLRHADGSTSSWSVDLPINEITPPAVERCPRCGERLYGPAETETHNRTVHNFGPVGTVWAEAEPETRRPL
jgi:hypothetical protein